MLQINLYQSVNLNESEYGKWVSNPELSKDFETFVKITL